LVAASDAAPAKKTDVGAQLELMTVAFGPLVAVDQAMP